MEAYKSYPKSIAKIESWAASISPLIAGDRKIRMMLSFHLKIPRHRLARLERAAAAGVVIPPDALSATFGASENDLAILAQWLTANGYTTMFVSADRTTVYATATVANLETTLHVTMAKVEIDGEVHVAATSPPKLPKSVGQVVKAIVGLQPFIAARKGGESFLKTGTTRRPTPILKPKIGNAPPYLVTEIKKAYAGEYLNGDGAGQTIAILIDTFPKDSDLQGFWAANSLPASIANIQKVNVQGGALPAPEGEETLDVEWTSGLAPAARIRVYATKTLAFVDLNLGLDRILADLPSIPGLRQLSISLGRGEAFFGGAEDIVAAQHDKYLRLAAAGVNVFVSSGDAGSHPDPTGHSPTGPLNAEYPASDPCVVGVGGTGLRLASNGTIQSEVGWRGSGGGVSRFFTRPAWQSGPDLPPNSGRLVPDVAAAADPALGAYVHFNGAQSQIGGTSWSAPIWASLCALFNQYRLSRSLQALPFINPVFYGYRQTSRFRDITSGSNGEYQAKSGYDLVTGLGAPRMTELVRSLTSGTLIVSPLTDIVASGIAGSTFKPASFAYEVKSSAGAIEFTVSGTPSWLTVSPTSGIATGNPLTVTFSVNTNASTRPPGTVGPAKIEFLNSAIGPTPSINATLKVRGPSVVAVQPTPNMYQEMAWSGALDAGLVIGEGWRLPNGSLVGAIIWVDGKPETVEYPPGIGVESTRGMGCDASGKIIVGDGIGRSDVAVALVWRRRKVTTLRPLSGDTHTTTKGVSADGKTIIGTSARQGSSSSAVRWLNDYQDPESLGAGFAATAVNSDGQVIVGHEIPGAPHKPVVWSTQNGTLVRKPLPIPDGYLSAYPQSVSADGRVIVGVAQLPQGKSRAVIWRDGAPSVLEPLPQAPDSHGFVVSGSGAIVFGIRAGGMFRWTAQRGVELIADIMADANIDISAWVLERPTAVSSDGSIVSGLGRFTAPGQSQRNRPFLLELPPVR